MEARAATKHVRIAPRKLRLVVDLIRGKKVGEALAILKHTPKAGSPVIEKVLRSAIANAENNLSMDIEKLFISKIFVDQASTLKRFHPRAQGRAFSILKHTSHVTVIVSEK